MLVEMVRDRPALAADLLDRVCPGLTPAFTKANVESGDLAEHRPASYDADAVVTLGDNGPLLAVVVEVQLRRDSRKHLSWPAYVANARARLGCPTVLLVVCLNDATAAWACRPIPLGHPGLVLAPLVLGPQEVPPMTNWEPGGVPELTVLSAVVHGAGPDGSKIFDAMLDCMRSIERDRAQSYIDEVLAVLPEAARNLLEAMVKTRDREYHSDFARGYYSEGKAEGKAEGRADMVLAVLSVRGITVSEPDRTRITECTDLNQLEEWGRRAVTAASVDDLFN